MSKYGFATVSIVCVICVAAYLLIVNTLNTTPSEPIAHEYVGDTKLIAYSETHSGKVYRVDDPKRRVTCWTIETGMTTGGVGIHCIPWALLGDGGVP